MRATSSKWIKKQNRYLELLQMKPCLLFVFLAGQKSDPFIFSKDFHKLVSLFLVTKVHLKALFFQKIGLCQKFEIVNLVLVFLIGNSQRFFQTKLNLVWNFQDVDNGHQIVPNQSE